MQSAPRFRSASRFLLEAGFSDEACPRSVSTLPGAGAVDGSPPSHALLPVFAAAVAAAVGVFALAAASAVAVSARLLVALPRQPPSFVVAGSPGSASRRVSAAPDPASVGVAGPLAGASVPTADQLPHFLVWRKAADPASAAG